MTPQEHSHANAIGACQYLLMQAFPVDRFWVRVQLPLEIGDDTEPEPDLAVVEGKMGRLATAPTTALLVVEISRISLSHDRAKGPRYAKAGVAEYWVVDLNDDTLEVYRQPREASAGAWRYGELRTLRVDDVLSPVAASQHEIRVSELLP